MWLMEEAAEDEQDVRSLTLRILTVNFAAIHTSSMVCCIVTRFAMKAIHIFRMNVLRALPMRCITLRPTQNGFNPFERKLTPLLPQMDG